MFSYGSSPDRASGSRAVNGVQHRGNDAEPSMEGHSLEHGMKSEKQPFTGHPAKDAVLSLSDRIAVAEPGWGIAVASLVCYVLAVFFSMMSPLSMCATLLMILFSALTMLLEVYFIVVGEVTSNDKHHVLSAQRLHFQNVASLVCRDGMRILRGLLTTLVPLMLVTFEGVSFLAQVQITAFADGCSVANLTALDRAGYLVFSCRDGHVATHLQQDVHTWREDSYYSSIKNNASLAQSRIAELLNEARNAEHSEQLERDHMERRRAPRRPRHLANPLGNDSLVAEVPRRLVHLGARRYELPEDETNGEMSQQAMPERMRGYVAPIYQSACRQRCPPALRMLPSSDGIRPCCAGMVPVAWAVSAGQPIVPSSCASFWRARREQYPTGTCGIFALPLKDSWSWFTAPSRFGKNWGFNITHFHALDMAHAVAVLKATHAETLSLAPDPFSDDALPYVIAQPVEAFFGTAYPFAFICMTLIVVGLLDRCLNLTEYFWRFHGAAKHPQNGPEEVEDLDVEGETAVEPSSRTPRLAPKAGYCRSPDEHKQEHGEVMSLFATAAGLFVQGTSNVHDVAPHKRLPSRSPRSPRGSPRD